MNWVYPEQLKKANNKNKIEIDDVALGAMNNKEY